MQALRGEHRRAVHLVNRNGIEVLGRPSLTSLKEIDGRVDLVAIAVPMSAFEDAVNDALAKGARAIVGITAGFAELGVEGKLLQDRVVQRIRGAGAVLLGPNCLGVTDATTEFSLSSNPLPVGSVSLFSQSGNMALELGQFMSAHNLGFARFASLGNQADLCAADLIRHCVDHEGTRLIALYCEDFKDGRDFVNAAIEARRSGKPVVLLTVGGSEASIRGAQSHTGSLTSSSAVIDAACRAAGIYRVYSPRELADVAAVLLRFGMQPLRSVAVLADGGGHASVAADVAEAAGLSVPTFSEETQTALRAELPPSAGILNPIDVAGAGERDITSFGRVLDAAIADRKIDAVVVTGYFCGYWEYSDTIAKLEAQTAEHMAAAALAAGKPLVVHTMWPDSQTAKVLRQLGVPVFRAVEDALRALGIAARATEPRAIAAPVAGRKAAPLADDGYWASRALLADAGLSFPYAELVDSVPAALEAANRAGYPVVLKAMGLLHKSDSGGVALRLAGPEELTAAFEAMHKRVAAQSYCVEAMAELSDSVELIVGVQTDPRFGSIAMVGLGGTLTEVLKDVAFALAPVDAATARDLLESLRAAAILHGVRGRPGIDLDAAAAAIVKVTEVAAAHPEIGELEVNPLMASPSGTLGLDARVILAAVAPSGPAHSATDIPR